MTGVQVAEEIEIPEQHLDGSRSLYRTIRMCQQIDEALTSRQSLEERAERLGVRV